MDEKRGRGEDHPRIRGEHRQSDTRERNPPGSSPHTRGALDKDGKNKERVRIIPAYAGSTFRGSGGNVPYADHPRIRGEHELLTAKKLNDTGSSPHTRGALAHARLDGADRRIIPAYAGSTGNSPGRR